VLTDNFIVLVIAGIIGVISPSGGEIGPLAAVKNRLCACPLPQLLCYKAAGRVSVSWHLLRAFCNDHCWIKQQEIWVCLGAV
jgi:hypothetical protein